MGELEEIINNHKKEFMHPTNLPSYENASIEQKGAVLVAHADLVIAGVVSASVTMRQFYEMVRIEQEVGSRLNGGSGLVQLCYVQGSQDRFVLHMLMHDGGIVQGSAYIPKYGALEEKYVKRILPRQNAGEDLKRPMTRDELYAMIIDNINQRSAAEGEHLEEAYVHEGDLADVQKEYVKLGYKIVKTREEGLETGKDDAFRIYRAKMPKHLHAIAKILRADVLIPCAPPYAKGHAVIGQDGEFSAYMGRIEALPRQKIYVPKAKKTSAPDMTGVTMLRPIKKGH